MHSLILLLGLSVLASAQLVRIPLERRQVASPAGMTSQSLIDDGGLVKNYNKETLSLSLYPHNSLTFFVLP
jgi:hypothetical protein